MPSQARPRRTSHPNAAEDGVLNGASAARLVADAPFEPVDAGSLDNPGLLEHLALLVIRMAFRQRLGPDFGLKILRR